MLEVVGAIIGFCIVFISVRRKISVGLSLILGAVIVGVFSLSISGLLQTIVEASTAVSTLELIATIASITFLNFVYESTGSFQNISENLSKMVSSRSLIALVPIIFGILPVSGGALFSAPLVDHEGDKLALDKDFKAFLNLWFRHIPHLLNPLETALIILSYLTKISLLTLIIYQVPVLVVGMAVGFLLGPARMKKAGRQSFEWRCFVRCLVAFLPMLVAVALTVILGVKTYLAVIMATVLLFFITKPRKIDLRSAATSLAGMALAGLGTMIFRNVFEASEVLVSLSQVIQKSSAWPPLLLVIVPLLIGFALGESTPAMTLSLSVLSFMGSFTPASACIVYTCMYFGHLVSPTHLCFVATSEYFHAGTLGIYRRLVPATLATLAMSIPILILLM